MGQSDSCHGEGAGNWMKGEGIHQRTLQNLWTQQCGNRGRGWGLAAGGKGSKGKERGTPAIVPTLKINFKIKRD